MIYLLTLNYKMQSEMAVFFVSVNIYIEKNQINI